MEHTLINLDLVASTRAIILDSQSVSLKVPILGTIWLVMYTSHLEKTLRSFNASSEYHLWEYTILIGDCQVTDAFNEQAIGVVKFFGWTIAHDQDTIRINNSS